MTEHGYLKGILHAYYDLMNTILLMWKEVYPLKRLFVYNLIFVRSKKFNFCTKGNSKVFTTREKRRIIMGKTFSFKLVGQYL